MKKLLLLASLIVLSTNISCAQGWRNSKRITGNKDLTSTTRSVGEYNAVSVYGPMDVELVAGNEGTLKIEAESNLIEYITTQVEGGNLKIAIERGVNLQASRNMSIKITVPFKDIEAVRLTGSGDIWNTDVIKSQEFQVEVTGSGDITLDLKADTVIGGITGSGDITFKGDTNRLKCSVKGSGDFKAFNLNANDVKASVTGSGDIEIMATQELKASVSGSGDITYKGNPEKQDFKTSGSGSVSKG
ncbi:DUF2807 domain-containing protein [Gillisia sp. M10.2A]|uniref:DUF2807 domain-containing protein n=1 Tax=Gillisia lutea TaxID=2909668 RepID=A0ABS9EMS4_9FLAO|nr:head GIN domain-containing protein [Gillisia lutea]MCF4102813.1 DUF2807 domain-containing protein [Gillisia lutea]